MRYSKINMNKIYNFLFVLLIIAACNSKKTSDNWDKENTRNVAVKDTTYLNSIALAKQNLPIFIDSLKRRGKNHYDFYIKSRYSEGKNVEHLWFVVDTLKIQTFVGILDNVPLNLRNIKLHDKLDIKINDVEDWIIYKGDKIVAGNYLAETIK
jgi:uncharacterized protein YegJ (DUF2314 family)